MPTRFALFRSRTAAKIMLPEISIKRDSVRIGIRLNLSSYSTRGWKETFRTRERLARDSKWPTFTVQSGDSLIHLVCSLSFSSFLAQPSSLFLSISPSPTHFLVRIVCLSAVRCHRTRIGSPKPQRDFGLYCIHGGLSLCSCRDLGQRSSREAKGKERNMGASNTYVFANTWASKFPAPKGNGDVRCRVRSARIGDISQGGGTRLLFAIDLFRHRDSIRNQSYMMRDWVITNKSRGNYSETTNLPRSDTKRVLPNVTGCRHSYLEVTG